MVGPSDRISEDGQRVYQDRADSGWLAAFIPGIRQVVSCS